MVSTVVPRIPALGGSPLLEGRRRGRSHDETQNFVRCRSSFPRSPSRRAPPPSRSSPHWSCRAPAGIPGGTRPGSNGTVIDTGTAKLVPWGVNAKMGPEGTTPVGSGGNPLLVWVTAIGVDAESAGQNRRLSAGRPGHRPRPDRCPIRTFARRTVRTAAAADDEDRGNGDHPPARHRFVHAPPRKARTEAVGNRDMPGQAGEFPHLTSRTRIAGLSPLREWASPDSVSTAE